MTVQGAANRAHELPSTAQKTPKSVQVGPKSVQVCPKCAQVGPKSVQERPSRPEVRSSWPQVHPSWPQVRPSWPQERPSWTKARPKSLQVGPKLVTKAAKWTPSMSKLAPKTPPRGVQERLECKTARTPKFNDSTAFFALFFQGSAGLERGLAGALSHLAELLDGSLAVQRPSWTAKCVQEPPKEHRTARQTGPERPKSTGRRARRGPRAVQQARQ